MFLPQTVALGFPSVKIAHDEEDNWSNANYQHHPYKASWNSDHW